MSQVRCVLTAVKMLNDAYAEFASRYPDRTGSYVMLPLLNPSDPVISESYHGLGMI
jgi:hypothetical protein